MMMKLQQLLLFWCILVVADVVTASTTNLRRQQQQRKKEEEDHERRRRKLIIGGTDANGGDYPFIVSWHKRDLESHPNCAGSLVAPNMVLTVASCANSIDSPLQIGSLYPTIANHTDDDYTGVSATIKEILIHPLYDGVYYDFCLLVLSQTLNPRKYQPLELNFVRQQPSTGTILEVIGYGTTVEETWTPAPVLQTVSLVDVSYEECRLQYSSKQTLEGRFGTDKESLFQIRNKFHICTGSVMDNRARTTDGIDNITTATTATDACYGDSGGPIIMTTISGVRKQVGMVSTKNGCALPDQSGVYPRISIAQPWLTYEICSKSVPPHPDFCQGFTTRPTTSVSPSTMPSNPPSRSPSSTPSSHAPSGVPTAPTSMPSRMTSTEPSLGSTGYPTVTPRPSVTPTACPGIVCSDTMAPHMLGDGLTCPTTNMTINKCQNNAYWTTNQYCQLSCYQAGFGYDGVFCCNAANNNDATTTAAASSSASTTTKAPSASPTIVGSNGLVQHEDCTECDNLPNDYMLTVGSDCETSSLIATKCNGNNQW
eukprot:CAMPEP_0194220974 /NCGR_PEP_ID=MMETSP0156-20130528/29620_1 /TAXON_ID=33649 /ORGANISM="Thalassionema nitzschioides, Strain L26-B" /LENGTH=539 /DNA_ID=CAMNT_0038951235 /DNA_START=144 /DNA_END=1760 /DNA_ORIENTATION=+